MKIGGSNSFPANYNSVSLNSNSTVEYYGNNQSIVDYNYGNLILTGTSGTVVKTMPATNLIIYGDFTASTGTASSLSFVAASNIDCKKDITIGANTTFNGGSFTHQFRGDWENNGTFSGATSMCYFRGINSTLSGTGTNNFYNLKFRASGITANNTTDIVVYDNISTVSGGNFTHDNGGTVTMAGTNKSIYGSGFNFYNLVIADTITSSTPFNVNGDFTCNGSFIASSGNIIHLNGLGKSILGTGFISFYRLYVNGTITTTRDFTMRRDLVVSPSGSFTATNGLATFAHYTTLTGRADFYDIIINSGKTLRVGVNSILGIANEFTRIGNLSMTSTSPNLVEYNGSGNQNVVAESYYNLTFANGAIKTTTGDLTVQNDLTINSGVELDASSNTITIYGDWINNGDFTSSSSTVEFESSSISNIYGETSFNDFKINKNSSSTHSYLKDNVSANNIIMTKGILDTESDTITTLGGRTGNGIIYGTITHNHSFSDGTAYYFEGPDNSVTFTSPSGINSVSVHISTDEVTDFNANKESIEREYEISIPSGTYTNATLRFHYEESELSAFEEPFLAIYKHNTGIIWDSVGYTSRNTTENWVEKTGLTSISGRYTFSGQRKVLEWNGSVSDEWEDPDNWTVVSGSDPTSRVPTSADAAKIGTSAFTNQPTISDSQNIAALRFGSTQAVTLTLNNTLSTTNSVKGYWSSNQTHTINVGSSQFDIGSNLLLSDGTIGHLINITASTGDINVANNLIHKATSSITFSGAGNLTIEGNYKYTSGIFTPSTSTVTYSGSISQIVAPLTYYNLAFTKTNERASINSATLVNGNLETSIGGEVEINDTLNVNGNISIGNLTTMIENNSDIYLSGHWTNNGTFTPNSGSIFFNGSTDQNVNQSTFNHLVVDKSSGTLTLTDSISINGDFTVSNGTVDLDVFKACRSSNGGTFSLAPSTNLLIGGTDNFPCEFASTDIDSLSTVEYNGTSTQVVLDDITYGYLTFSNGGSNEKTISGNIAIQNDILVNSGATIGLDSVNVTLYGDFTNSGTINPGESTFTLNGISKTMTGPFTLNNLTVNGTYTMASGTTSMTGNFYIENTGSFDFGNNDVSLDGDLTNKGSLTSNGTATFTGTRVQNLQLLNSLVSSSTGIVNFNGTFAPVVNSTSPPSFATVNINNTDGITASTSWSVFVACNIAAGATFNAGPFAHTFYGNFTNDGTVTSSGNLIFSPGAPYSASGTIILDGTSFASTGVVTFSGTAPITINDNNPSFNDIVVTNTNALGVTSPSSWTIGNELQILSGATFNAGSSTNHTIVNSLVNNGTLNGETSTITFDGVAVNIDGTGTTIFNNLTIDSGTSLELNKSISISKDLVNDGAFSGTGRTVTFTGTSNSTISGAAGSITIGDLEQNKTGATTTLQIPVTISDGLIMTDGIIHTDATNILTLEDDAISSPGTNTSFVDGPMKKIGDDAFIFPLGDGTIWARLGISAPSQVTDEYIAEYFDTHYVDTVTMAASPTPILNNVSTIEYWTCDRNNGSSNVTVQLYWEDAFRSGISSYSTDLVVARWNGAAWENNGQSAIVASTPGNITSNTISSFSPFTFGSTSGMINPLPIELTAFNVEKTGRNATVKWTTVSEINNDYFTIEKSSDGFEFNEVEVIDGAGNSSIELNYSFIDYQPYDGISYYRLKQTDFDGGFKYSEIKAIEFNFDETPISYYPNPFSDHITLHAADIDFSELEIYNTLGQNVSSLVKRNLISETEMMLDFSNLKNGIYRILTKANSFSILKQ